MPNPNGPGWILTPERAATCAHHPDRPLARGDKLFCDDCRAVKRWPPDLGSGGPSPDDPRLDPDRCVHCGAPRAPNSLIYCGPHRDRQRERSRRSYKALQRKGRR